MLWQRSQPAVWNIVAPRPRESALEAKAVQRFATMTIANRQQKKAVQILKMRGDRLVMCNSFYRIEREPSLKSHNQLGSRRELDAT
jgi:hypothetical protein